MENEMRCMQWKKVVSGVIIFVAGILTGIWAAAQYGLAVTKYDFVVQAPNGKEIARHSMDDEDGEDSGEIPIE